MQIPFRWTVAKPDGSSTIQLEQVQQNVPINDSKFAKPGSYATRSNPRPCAQIRI